MAKGTYVHVEVPPLDRVYTILLILSENAQADPAYLLTISRD